MAIKKVVPSHTINYNSKKDSNKMEKIVTKQKDYYLRNNENGQTDVENVSFDTEHIVTNGETLSQIAAQYGLSYQELADYNNIPDPNVINIGQVINIPTNMKTEKKSNVELEHQVTSGETLSEIAAKYGLSYQELADYNHIDDPNYIEVNQVIKIPGNEEEVKQDINEQVKNLVAEAIKNGAKNINEQVNGLAKKLSEINSNNQEASKEMLEKVTKQITDALGNTKEVADSITKKVKEAYEQEKTLKTQNEVNEQVKNLVAEAIKNGAQNINEQVNGLAKKLSEINSNNQEASKEMLEKVTKQITDALGNTKEVADSITKKVKEAYEQEKTLKTQNEVNEQVKNLVAEAIKNGAQNINEQVKKLAQKINDVNTNNQEMARKVLNQLINETKNAFYNEGYTDPSMINNVISLVVDTYKVFNQGNLQNKYSEYTIASGDTLSKIAAQYGISLDKLIEANNITDPNNISVGQVLKVPAPVETPKKQRKVTRDIDLTKVLKDSVIAKAIEKYSNEIKEAFKVKIDADEMITITETVVDGNSCFLTHVIISDPSKINGEPANGEYATGVEKTSSAAKRKNVTLMINGSNFIEGNGSQDLRNTNHLAIVNGKIVHDGSSAGMEICLDKNGRLFTPSPGTTATDLINQGVIYSFASLDSRLIWNGERDYVSQPAPGDDNAYNSTVIGMTEPGEYYILTGSTTNVGAREFLYDMGCTYAKSMDQGGSVTLVFKGEVINTPTDSTGERSVGDFLYFA